MRSIYKLEDAVAILNSFYNKDVVSIMYEDGSGTKFIYKLAGDKEYTFFDLSKFLNNLDTILKEIAKRTNTL